VHCLGRRSSAQPGRGAKKRNYPEEKKLFLEENVLFAPSEVESSLFLLLNKERAMDNSEVKLDFNQIKNLLPHRYPFLLVDKILEIEKDKRIVGIKNVSINENFFQGHFPDEPIMPGVLIVEAMAQTAAVLVLQGTTAEQRQAKVLVLGAIKDFRFQKPVRPGDQLRFEVELLKFSGKIAVIRGSAFVGKESVAQGEMIFGAIDKKA
jgi:3-hydroxyacyl-[acyl-carrier-protein] dehydratase